MEDNQQEDENRGREQSTHQEATGLTDLAMTMHAMSIADPRISSVRASQLQQQEEIDFTFCLLMKIACTGGTPRSITKQALQQSMAKAWRSNYYAISQVSNSVFLAHFRSQEAMISVYTRQPWTIGSDNLLFDWFDPGDELTSSEDYRFEYIFVTVRAYGIPRVARSISLLADILNQVGTASEYHILQQNMLYANQDYIWGVAKMRVSQPVKDKVEVIYPDNSTGIAYLHYEKIKRICLFCGLMFHNVRHCPIRNNMLQGRSKRGLPVHDFPAQRYGQWIIDEDLVPLEAIRNASITNVGLQQRPNPILQRLQRLFAEDPKGKGKQIDQSQFMPAPVHQGQNRPSATVIPQGQIPAQSHNLGSSSLQETNVNPLGTQNLLQTKPPVQTQQYMGDINIDEVLTRREGTMAHQHTTTLGTARSGGTYMNVQGISTESIAPTTPPKGPSRDRETSTQHEALLGQQSRPVSQAQSTAYAVPTQQGGQSNFASLIPSALSIKRPLSSPNPSLQPLAKRLSPQEVSSYQVGPNAALGDPAQGRQKESRDAAQSGVSVGIHQDSEHDNMLDNRGTGMELDDEALAPAFKAPRAP